MGAGYMHYRSDSYVDGVERKCTRGFVGANLDLTLSRHLFHGLYLGVTFSCEGGHTDKLKEKVDGRSETIDLGSRGELKAVRMDAALSLRCVF